MAYTKYEPIGFENAVLVSPAKVDSETGVITPPVYSGNKPIGATTLNHLEQGLINLEDYATNLLKDSLESNSTTNAPSIRVVNEALKPNIIKFAENMYETFWYQATLNNNAKRIIINLYNAETSDNITVYLPLDFLKLYSGTNPYFIKNATGLIYQCFIDDNNVFNGLNRIEAGAGYVANIYAEL